ncbi:YDG domain-containing protein [Gemmiger formicilis]|uniref:YDG domain-containing protein n=1 Tax=Gemmiger formicilis TaxID=745368 RepID=UPI0011C8098B|nr:YDG domain-containing protein [Gemmiger formicilis]
MKKRVLSMLMTLALCLTLLPTPAWAAEDAPEGGVIVQQEQQEEISPAVSEQAGTNEEENGSEGDPQNTGTPDAGGAEDSKADAPENGEDENAGNNADAAVSAVQTMIDALPTVSELDGMTAGELDAAYNDIQAAYDAYEALNAEQQAQITGADFEALLGWFNSQTAPLADAKSGVHTHCVCGKDSSTTVNGHTHNTGTTWTATNALPSTAGSYYLTQSVSENWTVPTDGEVTLCLNGQTINGKITVGDGATLTLTDCSGNGKVQGEVTVNGGKFELYSGTITGGVQVGMKGGSYNTGSAFTMYGGAITGNEDYGGVFLVGTTNHIDPPSFTMHGGTISDNTAGASDGGGGGVYVGEKCSFTMDGGTITGNTATAGNGGGIYIHFNAGTVSISNATITGNKASATGDTRYGHGGGIYSERGVTVKNVTITGNNSTFEGGGIYGKGAITLTDATVTDNSQYDVYYDGRESNTPELTISGSVKAGYYANYDWKLPILVSGALSEDSVIRVGVREGINPGAIAEPASGVTLSAENFKADAADSVTSLGNDGKVYLVPCTHEMDDTGYTCKKCHTQFDARVGDSAYYQTLTKAFDAARGSTVTLLRDVTLTGNCSSDTYSATLDLNGKTVSTENKYIHVGGGNKSNTLTVKDSSKGGGTQALNVKFSVGSNGTLAVDDSYTGEISRVELQAGGALERFGGKIGELVLSNAAYGSTSTGYGLKLWKGNPNACTIGKITDNTKSKSLTVNDLLGTDYAKCELYGEKDDAWSIVPKTEKISELTGYTAYKVQFTECVHQCADDSNPVCSVCHKDLYTKITAKAADGTTKTAYFTEDSALENGYVEAIQTLNGWSNEGCTEPTLTLLRDMPYGTSITLTGTLTLEGGTHTASNVTVAENANVTFASGSYSGATINGTATVETGVTFTAASVTVNGTLNAKGGIFNGPVKFNGSSTANISGGSFNCEKKYGGVEFGYNVTGTISGGMFAFADFYTTKVKLSGGTFTIIKTNGDRKLADLLAEGAAYYGASDNQAVTNDSVNTLENVKVVSHTHNGGTDGKGICSICGKQMAASLTVGDKTSWYAAFATAIEAANAADGEKTITLYQDVNGYADGHSTTYELTRGPVTLATGGKTVTRVNLIAKGISLTVTGSNGGFYVTVDGKDAELTVNDKDTKLAIVTAKNGGKLSLSNGTFSRVDVMNDGSSASLSGGSYGEITSGNDYVKPYALLAKGYAYKKEDNTWVSNANIGLSKVTVEKAPFAVEKIYPNRDTNYTGNSAFATDGNITLTAVIAPETQGVTYYYWWELFDESDNDWTTHFGDVNTATHTGEKSKTLTISGLPTDKSYQYHIFVQCSNGYQCYSEPFTVTQHQHSWTYTASGATITAKCTAEGCYLTDGNGGSVTIAAPTELTYSGEGKPATVTASSDWQGPAASGITISYIKTGKYGPEKLENDALPTKAGEYTASITVGEGNKAATASVKYTIQKANPVVTKWPSLSAPVYVNSEATLTGGNGEGTFDFKAGAAKSWDSAGSKTTTIVFTPTYTNNYNELTKNYTVTVVKRTVKSCNTPAGIMDKPYGTAQEELGLPGTVTITTEDGKTFEIPVAWNGYDPNTLEEQTLTGTLDLTSIADEVKQPSTPVTAQIKVKLTQKHFSGISPEPYDGVYDGNAHGITLTGVPSGATVKYGTSVNSCTKDSLTYTDFTDGPKFVFYKVSQSGYADASGNAWVNITKRPLTVTGITAKDKVYDGNTDAVLDYSAVTLGGVLTNDALTVTATGRLESAGVGEQKVTISDLTLDGDSAANYVLAESGNQSETTANITARKVAVTITPNGGTYGSVVAAAAKLTGAVDGENVPVTLTYTGNGYNDTAVPVNAGSYTVTASIADSNYTLTGNTTADFVITPKAVTVSGITANDKVYDGTTNADISSVTFDNVTLNRGTDYTVTASFDDAGVGNGKSITATVTLTEQAAKNYALEQSNFSTTGNITKAAAPGSGLRPAVTVINNLAKTYEMVLSNDYLPELSSPCEYGNVSYSLGGTQLADGYKNVVQAEVVEENGQYKLKLTVPAVDYNRVGSVGTLWLYVSSDNYQDFSLDIGVKAKNKDVPVPDGTISASDITYGQALNDSKIAGKMKAGGKAIDGTFTWTNGTFKPAAGDYPASWTFTPAKGFEEYATATGTATVTVDPKAVTVSGITANGKVYDGTTNAVLDYSNAQFDGILENDKLTVAAKGVFEKAEAGKQNVAISDLTLVGNSANNYVLAESGNQTRTTATIDPKSIDGATVVLGKGLIANGAEQTQTVEKVLLDGKELPANSYTVAGNTATAPGSHTLTITAKGNYTGTVEQTYVIIPAKAEDAPGEEIAIGSGEVKVVVKSEGTVPPATLLTNKAELLAMLVDSGDITADELAQIADGASVDIALTVKEANVSDEVKTAMAQAAKGYTIGQYLDISLFKYMTVNGNQQAGVALHTIKDALTISVAVPDALINTNSAVNRTYCIVRNHEGTITVLDAAFDAANKTLTFKTDRFSDYAIAYKDTAVPSSGSNPGSNNSSNGSETKKNEVAAPTPAPTPASTSKPSTITAMPQTGDTSNPTLYVVLLVASLLGLAVVFVCKKRNDK